MTDDDAWFAPKRFGYGAGLPIAWQGWALLGGYLVAVTGLAATLPQRHPALFAAGLIVFTVPLVLVAAAHPRRLALAVGRGWVISIRSRG